MLTKLADLRGQRKVAFFIATNRLAALDAAVTRPGRFDLQLFVGTPNLPARVGRLRTRLAALEPAGGGAGVVVAAFEAVMARRWSANARYLTFLETEKLAGDTVALWAARGGGEAAMPQAELEAGIEALLATQAAVMTVRGSVREDFDAVMGLSRL